MSPQQPTDYTKMTATQEDAVDAAAKYFLSLDNPYQALADADFSTVHAGGTEGSRADSRAIPRINKDATPRTDIDQNSRSVPITQSTQTKATAAEALVFPGYQSSSGATPDQPDEKFWCGEEGCSCSRKGDDRIKGRLFYGYIQAHYREKHPNLRFDKKRLRSHRDGPNGQKCLPMEPKTEEELCRDELRRMRKGKRKRDT